ncbi:MAG: heme NO-binding domain-containing protein [Thermodesulfobacteriota bacterium]|nr:heme NO-binding domain-containing protein [Thermodesulfobacteriota bacterium]
MKGTIVKCLKETVTTRFGEDKWQEICTRSDFPEESIISVSRDIDDEKVMQLFESTCAVLDISFPQAADAFGDYFVNEYAPNIYISIFNRFHNSRDFLLGMDDVHVTTTQNLPGAKPPRFTYSLPDERTIIMNYQSHRNLIDVLVGLVKGVGRYFNENLTVTKQDETTIKVGFD